MDTSRIGKMLDRLDAEHIARAVSDDHYNARATYSGHSKNTVADHAEFSHVICDYYRHHFSLTIVRSVTLRGGTVSLPDHWVSSEAWRLVDQSYRDYGGYEGAYRNARSGVAGGMHGVLNGIADMLRSQQEQQYIKHVLHTSVDPMDFEGKVELVRQYLDRFGGYLSPDERACSPADLARNFEDFIEDSARKISEMRRMIKHY